MTAKLRMLAVAAGTGRIGYVFFVDGKLSDWRLSTLAAKDTAMAEHHMRDWLTALRPNLVIAEEFLGRSTKGTKTQKLIDTVSAVAKDQDLHVVRFPRYSTHTNKYEEAKTLAIRFPEIADLVPQKPKVWETEPRNTVYFEALSLAVQIID